jgi:hypothetical protein
VQLDADCFGRLVPADFSLFCGQVINQIGERMPELIVGTQTTPVELADFFNQLHPDDEVAGKPSKEGSVTLYANSGIARGHGSRKMRELVAARVAVEVVLQHVTGMPGTKPLLRSVREQLAEDQPPRAGALAAPLMDLAGLYRKTVSALPDGRRQAGIQVHFLRDAESGEEADPQALSAEQAQIVERLIDKLVLLPGASSRRSKG